MNVSSGHGSAAKGSAKDLKVADCGLVGCHFFIPSNSSPCVVLQLVFPQLSTAWALCFKAATLYDYFTINFVAFPIPLYIGVDMLCRVTPS